MKENLRFTKKNTLAVKGIAIIFLLCYHCFSQRARLYGAEVSFWPLSDETVFMICRSMMMCVGMFAFLSAYGLTLSIKSSWPDYQFSGHDAAMFVLKRYVKLFFMFMLPFLFCSGITFVTGTGSYRYRNGFWENVAGVVMDFFGVGQIFGTTLMVNTWWFLSLEILIIVFMPFMIRFYRKYSWLMVPMILLPGSFLLEKQVHLTKYLFVVPLAVWFADRQILERLKAFSPVKNRTVGKILKFVLLTGFLLVLFKVYDTPWGIKHFEFLLNGLVPAVVIWWAYEFVIELPVLRSVLEFLGRHSADIFFTHTFVRSLWMTDVVYSFRHGLFIFLFLLGVSLMISFILDFIRKKLVYNKINERIADRFLTWADSNL